MLKQFHVNQYLYNCNWESVWEPVMPGQMCPTPECQRRLSFITITTVQPEGQCHAHNLLLSHGDTATHCLLVTPFTMEGRHQVFYQAT